MGRRRDGTLGLTGHLIREITREAQSIGVDPGTLSRALMAAAAVARMKSKAMGRGNRDAGDELEAARHILDLTPDALQVQVAEP